MTTMTGKIIELMNGFDVDTDALQTDLPLEEQGIDSMDMSALLVRIESTYHVEITDSEADNLRTLDDLAAHVDARRP